MAKKDTIAALKALGLTPDESKTDTVLKQELAAAKTVPAGGPVPASVAEGTIPSNEPAVAQPAPNRRGSDPIVVKYRDHIGVETERTFSAEVHGPGFEKLADEFKASNASKIIE